MMRNRATGIFLLALLALPWPGSAQEVTWSYRSQATGWIGITFDYTFVPEGEDEHTVVVISAVAEGSPAEEAGILVGDTLTHLDGQPISQRVFSQLSTSLEPGDLVRITIHRKGRDREVLVTAAERPQQVTVFRTDPKEMVIRLDTLRGAILREMDSLRLSITSIQTDTTREVSFHIITPGTPGFKEGLTQVYRFWDSSFDTLQAIPFFDLELPQDVGVPFPALFVDAPATDSLRTELAKLRRSITEVRREEAARKAELESTTRNLRALEELLRSDERIGQLREREQALLEEQTALAERLRHVSQEEMQRQWVEVQSQQERAFAEARRRQNELQSRDTGERGEREEEQRRALAEQLESQRERFRSPVIVGQSFILGAELKALNPDLAQYFGVDAGVLVTEVVEGTLADEAGLQSGDVIVRIAGEEITSLSDLRFVVAAMDGPIRMRIVRKGEPTQVVIRR